ncbi:MAG TPA: hypothetical protein VGP12_10850, partial [Nitrosospira sp.]|nr:hypothetical protein [Nitrosospira sp.]
TFVARVEAATGDLRPRPGATVTITFQSLTFSPCVQKWCWLDEEGSSILILQEGFALSAIHLDPSHERQV